FGAGGFGLPQACEHVGGGESAVHAPFAECARAFPQVGGRARLALILDGDDGGDEVRSGDGGDVLAHEPPEAAAPGAHDGLAVDEVAAREMAVIVAAIGEELAQRGAGAAALLLLFGGWVVAAGNGTSEAFGSPARVGKRGRGRGANLDHAAVGAAAATARAIHGPAGPRAGGPDPHPEAGAGG